MNDTVCKEKYQGFNNSWCAPTFDGWLCWPPTMPGEHATMGCPLVRGRNPAGKALKICRDDGIWEKSATENKDYTHYNNCIIEELRDLYKMCAKIEGCSKIIQNARIIEMVGLSFSMVTLLISLYIFFQYRVLKNNRTKIHKNLFIATLLHVGFRLLIYVDQEVPEKSRIIEETPYLYETCASLLEYSKTAMFMWMFIEGLYLHNMITVTVFQEYSYIKLYFFIGWSVPAVMTALWVVTMEILNSKWDFYFLLPCYWILEGPRCTVIVINLLFLINIIRVLIEKLRESSTSELEQVRKAVRAAIFLLPLLGIANILFFVDIHHFKNWWHLSVWAYTSYFLYTFQGFFVAVLYCFLNEEVQTAVKNSFYLHMSLRNYDYAPCRNLTLVSTAAATNSEPPPPYTGPNKKWIQYCLKHLSRKPNENDKNINVCELNGRHDHRNSTVTTIETKPLTSQPQRHKFSSDATDSSIIEDKFSESKV